MKTSEFPISLVGTGWRLTAVARLLLQVCPKISIEAACDPDGGALAGVGQISPNAEKFADFHEMLAATRAPWVLIGSPNCLHASQIADALEAGKHVFCEKPLATTLQDCLRVKEALGRHPGQIFFFGLVLRYSPFYRRIQSILESGEIGRIVSFEFNETLPYFHGGYIHGNWRRKRAVAGTHLLEKCCHDIDIANWLCHSRPARIASFGGLDVFREENRFLEEKRDYRIWPNPRGISPFNSDKDIVDNQVAIVEYESGARATFHTNCHAGIPERRISICGVEGGLRADALTAKIEVRRVGEALREEVIGEGDGHAGSDEPMALSLSRSITEGAPPAAGLSEALISAIACQGFDAALDTGSVFEMGSLWAKI